MSGPLQMKEIKKHKTPKSTWMVIHNDVYDVTSFLEEHPGGAESLLDMAGKDATNAFEDVGHSEDARELMKKYKIGFLSEEERTTHIETCCTSKKSLSDKSCCPGLPQSSSKHSVKESEKTWRTFDGSPSSYKSLTPKSSFKQPSSPEVEKKVVAIVIPRESPSNWKKYLLIALAIAIVAGVVAKKYSSK